MERDHRTCMETLKEKAERVREDGECKVGREPPGGLGSRHPPPPPAPYGTTIPAGVSFVTQHNLNPQAHFGSSSNPSSTL